MWPRMRRHLLCEYVVEPPRWCLHTVGASLPRGRVAAARHVVGVERCVDAHHAWVLCVHGLSRPPACIRHVCGVCCRVCVVVVVRFVLMVARGRGVAASARARRLHRCPTRSRIRGVRHVLRWTLFSHAECYVVSVRRCCTCGCCAVNPLTTGWGLTARQHYGGAAATARGCSLQIANVWRKYAIRRLYINACTWCDSRGKARGVDSPKCTAQRAHRNQSLGAKQLCRTCTPHRATPSPPTHT